MGEPGSVAWQFVATGIICIDGIVHQDMIKWNMIESVHPYDADRLEEQAIDLWAQDIEYDEGICTISTIREDFARIQWALYDAWYHIIQWDIEYIPTNPLDADDALILQIDNCIDALNDDDDVQKIWTNMG
jgi:transcriptional/translational regulatory protein YebC/TACO1